MFISCQATSHFCLAVIVEPLLQKLVILLSLLSLLLCVNHTQVCTTKCSKTYNLLGYMGNIKHTDIIL